MRPHPSPSSAQRAHLPGVHEDPGHQPRAEQQGQPERPAGEHRHSDRKPGERAQQEQAQRRILTPAHTLIKPDEVRGSRFFTD